MISGVFTGYMQVFSDYAYLFWRFMQNVYKLIGSNPELLIAGHIC